MSRTLSDQTIAIVKATVPALQAHGLDITRAMYARLFQDPAMRDLFNQSHHGETGSQPKALANAVLAYAQNIDNLGVLGDAVERIAQKHVGLQILPEHYPFVADALLAAIKNVLGNAATDEILTAWGEAYWFLADILIGRETMLYDTLAEQPGGWRGWRDFRVVEKRRESDVITSFVLRPIDGALVVRHRPGQYLTLWLDIPGQHPLKRNYSISAAANGESYRISVKQEPQGVASGWLHQAADVGTIVKASVPAGEFFLSDTIDRPVVLLSGGVGLTPMLSMLETLVQQRASTAVHYVHGTLNGSTHAMRDHVRELAAQGGDFRVTTFYQQPRTADAQGRDYDERGLITGEWLRTHTPVAAADFYLCGPKAFLRHFVDELTLAGVPGDRIHYEFFGPADELIAA